MNSKEEDLSSENSDGSSSSESKVSEEKTQE